jgi:hypothetical protein
MPRKLPWEADTSRASRPGKGVIAPGAKRQKLSEKKDEIPMSPNRATDGRGKLAPPSGNILFM